MSYVGPGCKLEFSRFIICTIRVEVSEVVSTIGLRTQKISKGEGFRGKAR